MKKIYAINARFRWRRITGVERYAGEVTRRLGQDLRLIAPRKYSSGFMGHAWEQFALPARLNKEELLWSPANTGPLKHTHQAITLHDLSFIDHPEWFKPEFALWYRIIIPRLVQRVVIILTDSRYFKQRIQDTFNLPARKVRVVPCGVDLKVYNPSPPAEEERVRCKYQLPQKYVLTVSSPEPRKNLERLAQAWEEISLQHPNLRLLVVGKRGKAFRRLKGNSFPASILFLGYIQDADMPALYSGALAVISASLYEGFGLTLLEAMACGTPVIAANTTAIPEVVGEAGLLVDPYNVEDMQAALSRIVNDADLRQTLSARGRGRAEAFSWERTAQGVRESLENSEMLKR